MGGAHSAAMQSGDADEGEAAWVATVAQTYWNAKHDGGAGAPGEQNVAWMLTDARRQFQPRGTWHDNPPMLAQKEYD